MNNEITTLAPAPEDTRTTACGADLSRQSFPATAEALGEDEIGGRQRLDGQLAGDPLVHVHRVLDGDAAAACLEQDRHDVRAPPLVERHHDPTRPQALQHGAKQRLELFLHRTGGAGFHAQLDCMRVAAEGALALALATGDLLGQGNAYNAQTFNNPDLADCLQRLGPGWLGRQQPYRSQQ